MSTTVSSRRPPDALELVMHDDRRVPLHRLGPSSQGWVYATAARDACYRVLPISSSGSNTNGARRADDAPGERRQLFNDWKVSARASEATTPRWLRNPVRHYLAPITEAEQSSDTAGRIWFYVRYDIRFARSLAEVLAQGDPLARLDHVIVVFYRMVDWWNDLGREGLLPMPADIVFDEHRQPFLLPAPFWRFPDAEAVLTEPMRGLYLAPEYVRGRGLAGRDLNLDRYALGVLALSAFRQLPAASDGGSVLQRAANGTLWHQDGLESTLPFWLQMLTATAEAEDAIRQLLAADIRTRSAVDPLSLATRLREFQTRMAPRHAIEELLETGRIQQASALFQHVLLIDDSYEILLVGARVARASGRPLDAVDLYEKAITHAPQRTDAYRGQFDVLTSAECRLKVQRLIDQDPDVGRMVDERVWRDFKKIEPGDPVNQAEVALAEHMLWRGQAAAATQFAYARLFDQDARYLWWKFPMRFQYVMALIAAGHGSHARRELDNIRSTLLWAHDQHRLEPDAIHYYGEEAQTLEILLRSVDQGTPADVARSEPS